MPITINSLSKITVDYQWIRGSSSAVHQAMFRWRVTSVRWRQVPHDDHSLSSAGPQRRPGEERHGYKQTRSYQAVTEEHSLYFFDGHIMLFDMSSLLRCLIFSQMRPICVIDHVEGFGEVHTSTEHPNGGDDTQSKAGCDNLFGGVALTQYIQKATDKEQGPEPEGGVHVCWGHRIWFHIHGDSKHDQRYGHHHQHNLTPDKHMWNVSQKTASQ